MRYFHESRNRKKMSLFTLERLQWRWVNPNPAHTYLRITIETNIYWSFNLMSWKIKSEYYSITVRVNYKKNKLSLYTDVC